MRKLILIFCLVQIVGSPCYSQLRVNSIEASIFTKALNTPFIDVYNLSIPDKVYWIRYAFSLPPTGASMYASIYEKGFSDISLGASITSLNLISYSADFWRFPPSVKLGTGSAKSTIISLNLRYEAEFLNIKDIVMIGTLADVGLNSPISWYEEFTPYSGYEHHTFAQPKSFFFDMKAGIYSFINIANNQGLIINSLLSIDPHFHKTENRSKSKLYNLYLSIGYSITL